MFCYTEKLDRDIPLAISSLQFHADDFPGDVQDISPPLHVFSTYRYPRKAKDFVSLWELKLSAEVSLYTKVLDEPIRCLVVVLIVFCDYQHCRNLVRFGYDERAFWLFPGGQISCCTLVASIWVVTAILFMVC